MTQQPRPDNRTISQRLQDTDGVTAALKRAAREAVREHARAGLKIVIWRDNQVVWIDPNELPPEPGAEDDA